MGLKKVMTLDFWAPPLKNGRVGKHGAPRRSSLRLRTALFLGGFAFVYMVCQAVMYVNGMEDWPESGPRRKPLVAAKTSIVALVNNTDDDSCKSPFDTTFGPVFYAVATLYTFLGLAIVCDEYFVESLDAISNFLHLSEDVAGATFMAAGSSAPELFTAIITILIKPGDEGLGTIVGSAVFNIMVIVGVTAIFAGQTLDIWWYPLCRDSMVYAISIIELVLFIAVVTKGQIDWWEGLILVFTYFGYLIIMVLNGKIVKFLGEVELNRQRRMKLAKKQKEKEKEEKEREEREKKLIEEELQKADQAKKDEEENSKKDESDDNSAAALGLTKWGAFRNRKVAPEQRIEESEMANPVEGDTAEVAASGDAPASGDADGEAAAEEENKESAPGESGEAAETEKEDESKDVGAFDENGFEIKESAEGAEGEEAKAEESGENKEGDGDEIKEEAKPEGEEEKKDDQVVEDEEEEKKRQEEALAKINNIFAKAAQARKEKKENDAPANPMLALLRAAADNDGAAPGANAAAAEEKGGKKGKKDGDEDENPFHDRVGVNPLYRKEFKATFDKNARTERQKAREDLQMKFTTAIVVESVATKWLEKIGKRRSTQEEIAKRKAEEEAKLKEEEEEEAEGIMSKIQGWILFIISFPYIVAMKFTIPDCRKDMFKKWFMITFIMSIVWIGGLSYFMVEFASRLGCIFDIPDLIMGLTIIAAGTSVPDALSSIVVAQNGQGDMAVANVLGSNVFNILLGLGFPWFLAVAFTGFQDPFEVDSDGVVEPVVLLFIYLFLFIGIIAVAKWRLFPAIGYLLISLDVVFIVYSITSTFCNCLPW